MLRSMKELVGYRLEATDGRIGTVHDFLFSAEDWAIRYFEVDAGAFLSRHRVILAPEAFGEPRWADRVIPVRHSREQVRNSPVVDRETAIGRRQEEQLHKHYNWMPYWAVPGLGGPHGGLPIMPVRIEQEEVPPETLPEPELRNWREISGYDVHGRDASVGFLFDLILDDETWKIKMAVVDTGGWLRNEKRIFSVEWVDAVKWLERTVHLDLASETIEKAPEFDPSAPVNREIEVRLYDFYGRPHPSDSVRT